LRVVQTIPQVLKSKPIPPENWILTNG
jgi:hypothetical protein